MSETRDRALEIVELVLSGLGMAAPSVAAKEGAVSDVEYWLRNNADELEWCE